MPRLIQLSPEGGNRYIGVDDEGNVWRGLMKRETTGSEYIEWKAIRSELPRST